MQPAQSVAEQPVAAKRVLGPEIARGMDTPDDLIMTEVGLPPHTGKEEDVAKTDAYTSNAAAAATLAPGHPAPHAQNATSEAHAAVGPPVAAHQPADGTGPAPDEPLQPEGGDEGMEAMEMDGEADAAPWLELPDGAAQGEEDGEGSDSDSGVEEATEYGSDESEPDEDDGGWGDFEKPGSSAYRFLHRDDPVFSASSQPSPLSGKAAVFALMEWRRRHGIRPIAFEELLRMLAEAGFMPANNNMTPSLYHARRIIECVLKPHTCTLSP